MRSLVGPMSGEIERTADQIIAGTSDPAVKRAAIELKIDAVPALREALFEPDPINAVIDTWVLLRQLAGYFETGPGRDGPRRIGVDRPGDRAPHGARLRGDGRRDDGVW